MGKMRHWSDEGEDRGGGHKESMVVRLIRDENEILNREEKIAWAWKIKQQRERLRKHGPKGWNREIFDYDDTTKLKLEWKGGRVGDRGGRWGWVWGAVCVGKKVFLNAKGGGRPGGVQEGREESRGNWWVKTCFLGKGLSPSKLSTKALCGNTSKRGKWWDTNSRGN